jgi:deoxyribodipyrimidine photo-lyase
MPREEGKPVATTLWWLRRDLRLADNQALAAALAHGPSVIPVFVLDPTLLDSPYAGEKRVAFLFGGLRQLDDDLRRRGGRLIVRRGDPLQELAALIEETGATAIYAEEDHSPYARQRDELVGQRLPLVLSGGLTVHPADAVRKTDGEPYVVFTPYSRAWKALPLPGSQDLLPVPGAVAVPPELNSLEVPAGPALPAEVPFRPGEVDAHRRLGAFLTEDDPPVYHYASGRDRLDWDGTSRLSPYLRFGMISARQALVSALNAIETAPNENSRKSVQSWLNELIWREFYISILHHFPQVREGSFRAEYQDLAWENDEDAFRAWCQGRTGYPVVDAAMRQLVETGWMHNRGRMIVASFLVKDLLVDWRWGERFFMEHLVDGDPASNNGGWQWAAGTGTDAAPYFRIFNPVLQGQKHDPEGAYVRRWVPELARVLDKHLHAPWKMPSSLQRDLGCVIGRDYPAPLIDHGWARKRTLEAFRQARERSV